MPQIEAPAPVKDKKSVVDTLAPKSKDKGKKKAEVPPVEKAATPEVQDNTPDVEEPEPLQPQDNGCEVTDPDQQSICLMTFYGGLPPLKCVHLACSDVLF